ncbi:flagellar hook-associated protein 3 FlgL [Steroidobacter denitrificans]|uniref:Flagellar hook-associated protein 3 FlgL n=1 Tax=Steroidobacter denitrificans TaxID=465721 RepID=A0A127F816_STEDE|nr:flagellar hook-associated protein FlgL [Steroidobacter denitrificans]AMN46586.1 flagellar hook-associated protein 3 FlgL [Steroidobacter denitrificans]
MRLSSLSFYTNSLAAMQLQSSSLLKLQNQVALGQRVNTPADDPIAAGHILELERAQSESAQFAKNSTLLRNRLNLEEQSLAEVGTVLTRVRELTLQASNIGTLSDSDRRSIATELAGRLAELQDIANRRDGGGEYLFAGFSTLTRPFAGGDQAPVSYVGDQGSRLLQISSTQRIADSHSGFDVFMNIPQGNGVFHTAAGAGNTGSGMIDTGALIDRAGWLPDDYTITFTSASDWEITDGASPANILAGGTFTAGEPIEFNGVRVTLSGEPAAGDEFLVNRARSEDIFATISQVIDVLRTPADSPAANAELTMALQGALQQLDQAGDHVLRVRAEVGARLSTIDSMDASRAATDVDLASALSDLRDLDYAQALTRMNQLLVGLEAAQLSYSKISQLSLFNYLR